MSERRLNLLFLTPQLPYPPHQGTTQRNFNILRGLAGAHDITLLSFDERPDGGPVPEPLRALCTHVETVPVTPRSTGLRLRQLLTTRDADMALRLWRPEFAARLAALLARTPFDIVQIEGIELARYADIVRRAAPQSHLVFDNHNAETELQRRAMLTDRGRPRRWPAALYSWAQVRRLTRFEQWVCMTADAVTVVSEADRAALARLTGKPAADFTVIPNCLDVVSLRDRPRQAEPRPGNLVFIGKMDYRPNIDAVLWFVDHIWPLVRARFPEATFTVVGQKPHARLDRVRAVPGVTLTGWVEAVEPYLDAAAVVVLPLRMGSGTRLKLIEALAAGVPIVATTTGAEGFAVTDDKELLIADNPTAFAAAIVRLLMEPGTGRRLTANAQAFATAFDWRVVVPQFNTIYRSLTADAPRAGSR